MTNGRRVAVGFTLSCLLTMCACDRRSPTTPGPRRSDVEGTWSGTVRDGVRGVGQARVTLAGLGTVAQGTFSLDFPGTAFDIDGDATASTSQAPVIDVFLRSPTARNCPPGQGLVLHAQLMLAADRLTGTYDDLAVCGQPGGGSLELARR